MDMNSTMAMMLDYKTYGLEILKNNIVPAVLTFIIGVILMKVVMTILDSILGKSRFIDPMLYKFIKNATKTVVWALIFIEVIKQLGIDASSVLTVFAAAGAAVALGLQGSLSNLASGIIMMFTKPFKHGDYISCSGFEGTVDSIDMLYTTLITADGKIINVPNSVLTSSTSTNFSKFGVRRIEIKVGISYESDEERAKYAILSHAKEDKRFLTDRPITCDVLEYADSAIILVFRGWVNSADYWDVFFYMNNNMKTILAEAGAEIPYPQIDVHTR